MIVSTRGRYALRVMIDLAEQNLEEYVPLKDISERQNISLKYMESIMTTLSKAKLVEGIRGKSGGYRLNRKTEEYNIKEILEVTEGSLAPVSCLETGAPVCEKEAKCRTISLWKGLNDVISNYLTNISLADLMKNNI